MSAHVVDASVLLAYLLGESDEDLHNALPGCLISTVNVTEVISRLRREKGRKIAYDDIWDSFGLTVISNDLTLATKAGELDSQTSHRGLSLGDRACLALALQHGLPVMTADRVWADLDIGVQVELIR